MNGTDDLAVFVTARLDDDEAVAKASADGRDGIWVSASRDGGTEWLVSEANDPFQWIADAHEEDVAHIALHDPARALRDIAAKRAILALHPLKVAKRDQYRYDPHTGEPIPDEYDGDCEVCGWFDPARGACPTVRALASAWSDDPRYRQEWKP